MTMHLPIDYGLLWASQQWASDFFSYWDYAEEQTYVALKSVQGTVLSTFNE